VHPGSRFWTYGEKSRIVISVRNRNSSHAFCCCISAALRLHMGSTLSPQTYPRSVRRIWMQFQQVVANGLPAALSPRRLNLAARRYSTARTPFGFALLSFDGIDSTQAPGANRHRGPR